MEYQEFLGLGLFFAAGFYSSGIMAGFHPSRKPNLTSEDVDELVEHEGKTGCIYSLGTLLCGIGYLAVLVYALIELNFLSVIGTALILHPMLTIILRTFISDKQISEFVVFFTVIGIPLIFIIDLFN